MTVDELIEHLRRYNPNNRVMLQIEGKHEFLDEVLTESYDYDAQCGCGGPQHDEEIIILRD